MSMAIIGITVSLVGTGVAFYGQQQAAKGAEYTAEYNAELATQQAGYETEVSMENARRKARENAQIIGLQRAAIAASGMSPEGTPLAILGDSVTTLQRDIMDMGHESAMRANQLHSQAAMALTEGANTATGLRTQSYATALSGVASATSGFLQAKG